MILFPRFDEDTQLIWDAAVKRGWNTIRGSVSAAQAKDITKPVIYGGVMWAQRVADSLGVSLVWPADDWLVGMPYQFTKRTVAEITGAKVKELTFPMFVKSSNWKDIASRTYFSKDDLPANIDDDKTYLVSEVVRFTKEFRAFVIDGVELATIGAYAKDGLLNYDVDGIEEATEFLKSAISQTEALPSAAIDVGFIEGRGWAFVEANAAWCSGIYSNNVDKVLDVLAACVV